MTPLLRTALALIVLTPAFAGLASCSDNGSLPNKQHTTVVPSSSLSLIQSFRFAPETPNFDAKREPGSLDVLWLGKDKPAARSTALLGAEPRGRRVIESAPGVKLTATSTGFAIQAPSLSRRETAKPARLTLPARLDEGFTVVDEETKLGIEVKLAGTTSSEGKIAETGLLVYENGFGQGRHVVHRPQAEGIEDYVVFEQRPEVEELRYEVQVPKKAGLRLVSNVLEVVDEGGAPRLRMTAPAVVQRDGAQVVPTVQVEGCAVDLGARLPWGRPVTAPGAEVCSVVVGWRVDKYPVVVDPAWTTTGAMKTERSDHTATLLLSGKVLVAGGLGKSSFLVTSEVYDPVTGTWSSGGTLKAIRRYHTATLLASGKVLVVGGGIVGGSLQSTEIYDPGTNDWTVGPNMATKRQDHTATLLPSGKVLVAGGYGPSGYLASSEVYDPISNTWTAGGTLMTARRYHTATALMGGKVLVAGGRGLNVYLASAEVYDPASNTWASAGSMTTARHFHTATALAGGQVLVAGGGGLNDPALASTEMYDPATGTWASGGKLTMARGYHTATLLPSGKVLVAGGAGSAATKSSEVYNSATSTWMSGGSMKTGRYYHTATLLPSDKVLVAGGYGSAPLASAEVWALDDLGITCSQDWQCASGHCSSGVCCDTSCYDLAGSCLEAKTGVPSGTCAPLKQGIACTQGVQCASGKCVDGVCCDTLCNGVCESCRQAETGQPDGTCAPNLANTDPHNECSSQGAGVCQTSGLCNGNGACADKAGMVCTAIACLNSNIQTNSSTCDSTGNCVTPIPATTDCAPYACKGTACLTACTDSADCAQGSTCIGGQCQGPKADGKKCDKDGECKSSFCVDGICCNNACDGMCQACTAAKTGGTTGICGTVQCAGDFKCQANVCPSSCTTNTQCATGNVCINGACVLPSANGKACDPVNKGTDCASSFCVDGVCCDSPCKGQCEACDVSGKVGQCIPVPKGDVPHNVGPGGRQLCAGGTDPICHGVCDGASASVCAYPGSSIHCGDSCEQNGFVAALCDSAGSCAKQKPVSCALYACKDSACLTSCSDETDCAAGSACINGQCQSLKVNGTTCGQASDCASGFCVDGVCCSDACDGACQACTAAKTGGTTGICGTVQCAGNFKCDANVCPSSCTTSDQCVNNTVCIDGICAAPKANGKACDPVNKGTDCTSSFCVDGVCCDSPCKGQCEACDISDKVGQCIPIPKGDVPHNAGPGGRQLCAGGTDPICHGVCDGASASTCVYPGPATTCDSSCQSDNATTSVCGGDGSCQQQTAKPCTPYACDAVASACKTSCETSADCSTGNVCNAVTKTCGPATSTCVDATHVKGTNGQVETCPAGYTCSSATGTCNTKCSSSAECDTASGYKCESSECKKDAGAAGAAGSGGAAGAAGGSTTAGAGTGGASTAGTGGGGGSTTAGDTSAEASEDDGGCGCEVPRSSSSTTWPGLAVAGLALASLRRRSRRR